MLKRAEAMRVRALRLKIAEQVRIDPSKIHFLSCSPTAYFEIDAVQWMGLPLVSSLLQSAVATGLWPVRSPSGIWKTACGAVATGHRGWPDKVTVYDATN
jgi:hypothetical protein